MTPTGPDGKRTWLLVAIVTGADAALRVRVWRELRKLGAVYLHSSVCLLPDQADVADKVETLSRRVRDSGGKAQVLKTVLVVDAEEAKIRAEQSAARDTEYGEVIERTGEFLAEIDRETQRNRATYTEVEESEADLERFDRWLGSIVARDYFHASGRHDAENAIQRCRNALAAFEAAAVAADTDSNSASSLQESGGGQPEFHAAGGKRWN
jgi:Protein ChrB, N-terminal